MISIILNHYKIMQNLSIVGIDISSATLDICVSTGSKQTSIVIANEARAIRKFFSSFKESLLVGMENTGRYNWSLYEVLKDLPQHRTFVIPPLHLKKSLGLIRGKNDKVDAIRIADFVRKNHSELTEWKPAPLAIQKLKVLITERNSLVKDKARLLRQQCDYGQMKHLGIAKELKALNGERLKVIRKQIKQIEASIESVIKQDEEVKRQADLIRSVPGVGKVLCWTMLAKTENFQQIKEPRKMACYSGVVPFDHQSGTSIRGRSRVSVFADKALKTILHLAAMSAIRLKNDLRDYYLRKVAEGKNKMSVLNAVRNKIIHRIFAVVKNQTTYKSNLLLS
jgi:transposase